MSFLLSRSERRLHVAGSLFFSGATALCWLPRLLQFFRGDNGETSQPPQVPPARFGSKEEEEELPDRKKLVRTELRRREQPPPQAEMFVGLRVRLLGLDMKEFNGREGLVLSWDEGHERWWIRLDDGTSKRLLPKNLEVVRALPPVARPPGQQVEHTVNGVDWNQTSRLAVENEMLRYQALQAAQYAAVVACHAFQQAPVAQLRKFSPQAHPENGGDGEAHANNGVGRAVDDGICTTLILRNLPNNYSRAMLLELLDREGFQGQYNLVYVPIDFKSNANFGYAFVNLTDRTQAERLWEAFDGFSRWAVASRKVCNVDWSTPSQGLTSHVERFRNSPVMHDTVPDEYKPILFNGCVRCPFPPPTRRIRAPRVRQGRGSEDDPLSRASVPAA